MTASGNIQTELQMSSDAVPGLYQVDVEVPSVAAGDEPVALSVAGFQSAAGGVGGSGEGN